MNQRLEGWRLVLAVLVPAIIVACGIWFLLQALGDDTTEQAIDSSEVPTATPIPTSPAEDVNEVAEPTPVPSPTPLAIPQASAVDGAPTSEPEATPEPTTAPAPTAVPAVRQPGPSGPTPTPTPDPDALAITCSGASFPVTTDPGDPIDALFIEVSPAEQRDVLQFLWDLGNGTFAGASNVGNITYATVGTYTIKVTATNSETLETTEVVCGQVFVGTTPGDGGGDDGSTDTGPLTVSCTVRPARPELLKWEDAVPGDAMRVTVSWTPADAVLDLTYNFPAPSPAVIITDASTGDNQEHAFVTRQDVMEIWYVNQETGERSNQVRCPAFTDPPITTYNQAGNP
ncbi:MAG: PKD domain-containing protein [Actinomycetota bacterium]